MEAGNMMVELAERRDTEDENKIGTKNNWGDSSSPLLHPFRSYLCLFMHAIWAVAVVVLLGILVGNNSTTASNNLNPPDDSEAADASNVCTCVYTQRVI